MGADQHFDWRQAAASALDWWRDAGVDTLVDEVPRDWLARTRPPPPPAAVEETPAAAALPATLAEFAAWRVAGDVPEARWGGRLFAAEGNSASDLMIVTDCPGEDGLVDGLPGRLLDRMLAAIGRSRQTVHLVGLAVARPLGGRLTPEHLAALAPLLAHHVALAAPKCLILLGQAPSRAILGTDWASLPKSLHPVNLNGTTVQVVASLHPRFLLERPQMKAEAWRDLQLVMGELP